RAVSIDRSASAVPGQGASIANWRASSQRKWFGLVRKHCGRAGQSRLRAGNSARLSGLARGELERRASRDAQCLKQESARHFCLREARLVARRREMLRFSAPRNDLAAAVARRKDRSTTP